MRVKAVLGRKIGMTQLFAEGGESIPVSVVKAGPCTILEKKSSAGKDGYSAIKLGFEPAKERNKGADKPEDREFKGITKPQRGYFDKLDTEPVRTVREIRVPEEQLDQFEVGGELNATVFAEGDIVTVTGKSKGRGFAGVMKRWNFSGHKASHGTHESFRGPGAVGCSAWPGRIFKGKKMPGQYGNTNQTIQNLEVVKVLPEENLLLIKGAIPGHRNSLIVVRNSKKKWKRG